MTKKDRTLRRRMYDLSSSESKFNFRRINPVSERTIRTEGPVPLEWSDPTLGQTGPGLVEKVSFCTYISTFPLDWMVRKILDRS